MIWCEPRYFTMTSSMNSRILFISLFIVSFISQTNMSPFGIQIFTDNSPYRIQVLDVQIDPFSLKCTGQHSYPDL